MYREASKIQINRTNISKRTMKQSYVYILKCSDDTYYTGVTSNLESRMFKHHSGFYPECYTYKRRPLELVFYAEFTDINIAIVSTKSIFAKTANEITSFSAPIKNSSGQ